MKYIQKIMCLFWDKTTNRGGRSILLHIQHIINLKSFARYSLVTATDKFSGGTPWNHANNCPREASVLFFLAVKSFGFPTSLDFTLYMSRFISIEHDTCFRRKRVYGSVEEAITSKIIIYTIKDDPLSFLTAVAANCDTSRKGCNPI